MERNLENNVQKKPMVILTGPTAVGKTALSLKLAKAVQGEIISADSMQVYEYMDIGSAKIMPEQMQGIPHHLINVLKPWDSFHVFLFQDLCKKALEGIYRRGHIPIVTGGTGFYIQALLRDIDFTEKEEDASYREYLEGLAEKEGASALHQMLLAVDPQAAREIHENNIKRTIRALEYYHLTGEPISGHNEREKQRERAYNACYFVLTDDRAVLYERIEKRVDEMMEQGLLDEVKKLKEMGCTKEMVSMQGLGYKELLEYLDGETGLEEAVAKIKLSTRHFAKRQLTWFRRELDVIWMDKRDFHHDEDEMLEFMLGKMQEQGLMQTGG